MPITDKHASYDSAGWQRSRDAVAGQRAIHAAGEAYLPKLSGQEPDQYQAYKNRACYYNATGRTVEGMAGLVFRKAPQHDFPPAMDSVIDDATLSGVSSAQLARQCLIETLQVARAGLLVDFPVVKERASNMAQAQALNQRPYITLFYAEQVFQWKEARVNNKMQPVLILLSSTYETEVDEWSVEVRDQIIELALVVVEAGKGHAYRQRIYRQNSEGDWYVHTESTPQDPASKPFPSIPFFPLGVEENTLRIQKPVIADLVDVNIAHYRVSADYEHGCHFAGLPTPIISGYQAGPNEKAKTIGSTKAWMLDSPNAKAYFLEFQGKGLDALKDNLAGKEGQMAALGARMLAPEKSGVEAAATLSMRHNGEQSALAGVANLVSEAYTRALRCCATWMGINGDLCVYKLSTDYLPAGMTAQELAGLVSAWQQGAISHQTLFDNLQRGEIIASDAQFEDEESRIADEGPTLAVMAATKPDPSETKKKDDPA